MVSSTQGHAMRPGILHALARNWGLIALRGVLAILFGVIAIGWPGLSLVALIYLYGAFVLAEGIIALLAAIRGEGGPMPRWWLALVGVAGIAAGVLTFFWPGVTAFVLLVFIGAWAVVRGVFEIIGAIRVRKEIDNEWWLVASGVLSVLFGLAVLIAPGAGALALVLVIGAYAIVDGVLLIAFALRLRKHAH